MSGLAYRQALAVLCSGHVAQPPARSLEPKPKKKLPDEGKKHARTENTLTPRRVSDAARRYGSNEDAAKALGCAPESFSRLCKRFGIQTPQARRRQVPILDRRRADCRDATGEQEAQKGL